MPLYEYECEDGHRFERIQKFSDPPVESCQVCQKPVRKLLSSPAIQFKGSGWYITDYAKKGGSGDSAGSKPAAEEKKAET
jgi:putative FmdB family regulatory protein